MRLKRILCATDFSADATCVLERAAILAKEHAAELQLMHVVPTASLEALRQWGPEPLDCPERLLAMLRHAATRGPLTGVMHSFTGAAETAAECLSLGMHISFAGMITFKKSQALRDVAATIPADRILIETDSPYLSPHPLRGRRNEPANVLLTAACIAAARGETVEHFAALTTANARRLFSRVRL